jgi:hypothetical protein
MLSDGRSKPVYRPHSFTLAVVGIVYLACVGGFVTVRALVEWLT